MKRITRLTESDLHRIVKESVNKVLKEARYAWDLTDDGVDEFDMDSGYPSLETSRKYGKEDNDYLVDKQRKARAMGQSQASGKDWMQNVHDPNRGSDFTRNNPYGSHARDFVHSGQYNDDMDWEYSQGTPYRINAEDDLNAFNNAERQKQALADKRWMKSADKRPLHRKGSLNREL